jgi:predicted Zn-dependent protease
MKQGLIAAFLAAGLLGTAVSAPAADQPPADGVRVGKASSLRKLVPAEKLEQSAAQQYVQMKNEASTKRALAPDNHPQLIRLRKIARELIPHSYKFNERARSWQWEVSLIASDQINAFCMPGGKIAFYTGILEKLKLTDDEVAMVMGHEVAHALREHARERIAKTELTRTGGALVADLFGVGDLGRAAMGVGGNLLTLKFSREDESESDLIGMEIAARAGYDPRAGVSLWQKMGAASKGAPPQWLSTHPSGKSRIDEIRKHLPEVMPIYERSAALRKAPSSGSAPAARAVR